MARILEFIRLQNAFDSETLVLLGAAYEKALRRARARGQPEIVREVIPSASRIIEMATKGERDPDGILDLERYVREVNNLAVDWCGYRGEQVLDRSETPDGLKHAIEGRIQALANVHSLFVKSRWIGAELSTIAWQELTPYIQKNEAQVRIQGPQVLLEPNTAQAIA